MTVAAELLAVEGGAPLEGGVAAWLRTADGVRLRAAFWPAQSEIPFSTPSSPPSSTPSAEDAPQRGGRARGVVALFQGRTEFIEKYYETIGRLRGLGFAVGAVDWRGQGLSDRPLPDRRKGYVEDFAQFQRDVDAFFPWLAEQAARVGAGDAPWALIGHSMGGGIAARTLMRCDAADFGPTGRPPGPGFQAAALSAPMLGIYGSTLYAEAAKMLATTHRAIGRGDGFAWGTDRRTGAELGFDGNCLTTDRDRFDAYAAMVMQNDGLALGGPTWTWLRAAYRETATLAPSRTPTLILLGDKDAVVSHYAAERYARASATVDLMMLPGALHEPFLESDAIQAALWPRLDAHFSANGL